MPIGICIRIFPKPKNWNIMAKIEKTVLINRYLDISGMIRADIAHCDRDIQTMQEACAGTYESIAENLPQIIERIDRENVEARALIDYFISGHFDGDEKSVVVAALEAAKETFVTVAKSINKMLTVDKKLVKNITEKVTEIESLRRSIAEISAISGDIELLSYNAVFVASQAGSSGSAFRHIAKEIKTLSNLTNNLARKMQNNSESLVAHYKSFNHEIETVNKETNQRLQNIDSDLNQVFAKYHTGLSNIADLIKQTLERSEKSKENIPNIMVNLQTQDLVRQLLEQIMLLNKEFFTENRTTLTTQLNFEQEVDIVEEVSAKSCARLDLSNRILNMVMEKLHDSINSLNGLLATFKAKIADIESDRVNLVDFFAYPQSSLKGKSSIQTIFDDSSAIMQDLITFLEMSVLKKHEAEEKAGDIQSDLYAIEFNFQEMRKIIKQFNIIKVVSKMEISREDSLAANTTASSDLFEQLTLKMDQNVARINDRLNTIKKDIYANIEKFTTNLRNQEDDIKNVKSNISESIHNLSIMRDHLNDAVKAVGHSSDKLFGLVDDSLNGVDKIRFLINQSKQIENRYSAIFSKFASLRESLQQQYPDIFGQSFTFDRFPDLIDIANKFAVTSPGDITTVEDEKVDQGGELTLF